MAHYALEKGAVSEIGFMIKPIAASSNKIE